MEKLSLARSAYLRALGVNRLISHAENEENAKVAEKIRKQGTTRVFASNVPILQDTP